ncbi:MAG: zf-HC2 domain-containing protein [Solirubrobacteraceae bacterium]|nr:zf-HC2 domain-containing protein [Solirubrobacteraceae bacterium]
MLDVQASIVTPEGVRDGDPAVLSGLTVRRGAAVLAYAERVAAPGRAVEAAADAFARFRRAVVEADDPHRVDPERTLLRTTRYAAAVRAPREVALRARLRRGDGPSPCELVPELLAARAEGDLGDADLQRLARHLARCAPCRGAEQRFRAGERAYRDAPDEVPAPFASRAIMAALLAVDAPARASAPAPEPLVEVAPGPVPTTVSQPTYEFDALPDDAFDAADTGETPVPAAAAVAAPAPSAADDPDGPLDPADALLQPTEAFDVLGALGEEAPVAEAPDLRAALPPLAPPADGPRRRRGPLAVLGLLLGALVVLAALAVTVVAVVDVAGS